MTYTKAQLLTHRNHRVTVSQRASCLDRVHPVRPSLQFFEGTSPHILISSSHLPSVIILLRKRRVAAGNCPLYRWSW